MEVEMEMPVNTTTTFGLDEDESSRRLQECMKILSTNVTFLPEPYCRGLFDGWTCWPNTPAGRSAYAPCPAFITGFDPSSSRRSHYRVLTILYFVTIDPSTRTIMEFSSHLPAIQTVAGQAAGNKYKTLNKLSRTLKNSYDKKSGVSLDTFLSDKIPQPLIPLVEFQIGVDSVDHEIIFDSMKSDDELIFHRVLKFNKIFKIKRYAIVDDATGDVVEMPITQFYQRNIWPFVSVRNRNKIIKALVKNLAQNNEELAEEFYANIRDTYGQQQAKPFLTISRESFIWTAIENHNVVFTHNEVKHLFKRYPLLVVKYLKLSKPDDDPCVRKIQRFTLQHYSHFLPHLLKDHSKEYAELIVMSKTALNIKLTSHQTKLFLKEGVNALVEHPNLFMTSLSLKEVTEKLSRSQFEQIFHKFLPGNAMDFYNVCDDLLKHLEFIPQEEKIPLMMSCFEKAYSKSMLDCPDRLTKSILKLMSPQVRLNAIKKIMATEKTWSTSDSWLVWIPVRSFLPTSESIPELKSELSKCQDSSKRGEILKCMIATCDINDDSEALLEVLQYIATRHKNERADMIMEFFYYFNQHMLGKLKAEHWEVLFDFLKLLHVKNVLDHGLSETRDILAAAIRFYLLNGLDINDKVEMYMKYEMTYTCNWNIIEDSPKYQRICIDTFIKAFPDQYEKLEDKSQSTHLTAVYFFMRTMYQFNDKNKKLPANDRLETFSIKNYPWLETVVKDTVSKNDGDKDKYYDQESFNLLLKKNERELYDAWVSEDKKLSEIDASELPNILRKNPEIICKNITIFYEKSKNKTCRKSTIRFLKKCRWYQDIPINLVEKCVQDIKENKDHNAVIILVCLLEGPAFEQFISPYTPKSSSFSTEGDDAKKNYMIEASIPSSIRIVNPPPSLEFILKFCEGDYIHLALRCLPNIGRRISVDKLKPFCQELMNRPVSVKKHGIRLFRYLATFTELQSTFADLWRKETHRSIRQLIVETIMETFLTKPLPETWEMVKECFDGLTNDDCDVLPCITKINRVPNVYIVEYFEKLMEVIKKIGNTEKCFEARGVWHHTGEMLRTLPANVAVMFPEDLHQHMLHTYLADLTLPEMVISSAISYLIRSYLEPAGDGPSKLDARLTFLNNMFKDMMQRFWGQRIPCLNQDAESLCFVAHRFVHKLGTEIAYTMGDSDVRDLLIAILLDTWTLNHQPQQAPEFYMNLLFTQMYSATTLFESDVFTSAYGNNYGRIQFANNIHRQLPVLIQEFSAEFIPTLGNRLHRFIEHIYQKDKPIAAFDIVEHLVTFKNRYTRMLALAVLCHQEKFDCRERVYSIIQKLMDSDDAALMSLVNMVIQQFEV